MSTMKPFLLVGFVVCVVLTSSVVRGQTEDAVNPEDNASTERGDSDNDIEPAAAKSAITVEALSNLLIAALEQAGIPMSVLPAETSEFVSALMEAISQDPEAQRQVEEAVRRQGRGRGRSWQRRWMQAFQNRDNPFGRSWGSPRRTSGRQDEREAEDEPEEQSASEKRRNRRKERRQKLWEQFEKAREERWGTTDERDDGENEEEVEVDVEVEGEAVKGSGVTESPRTEKNVEGQEEKPSSSTREERGKERRNRRRNFWKRVVGWK